MAETAGLTVTPLEGARFGAEISGLDPREITDAQREADSVVKEKQLRKTATRAVVALFNAVAKHQHPDFQDR